MKQRLENWLITVLLLLGCGTGLAWVHSSFIGYHRTWSDSRQQSCGRFASLRGHILLQRCDLAPFPVSDFVLKLRVAMPADFVVGSDPAGEREIVNCGTLAVPFASPQLGLFIGWQTRYASSTGSANQTRWSARWSEATIS